MPGPATTVGTLRSLMQSTVHPLEGNKVRLSVSVDEAEFDKALDAAFRKIAHEVRIDGFRPGKAPRRILEARVGMEYARAQALQDSIPKYLADAVRANEVDIIATPKIDISAGQESGPLAFDAEIEVRPVVTVPGYGGLRVEIPSPLPSDDDVAAQIDRMRQPFAELNEVERPIIDGDLVTVDLVGSRDDAPLPGLNVTDYLYAVGSKQIVSELDERLIGLSAPAHLEFTAPHPIEGQDPIDFTVEVKGVKEKVLPDLDDAWAAEASEFDTFDALRADVVRRLGVMRAMQSQMALREGVVEALIELVDAEPPDALVNDEVSQRIQDLMMRLQAQGISVEQYLAMQGKAVEEFSDELKATAAKGVKADLGLRAVADAEGLAATDDDIESEFANLALRSGQKAKDIRKAYLRNDAVVSLRAEIRKRKALEWLLDHCEVVDRDGNHIDRAALNPGIAAADSDTVGHQAADIKTVGHQAADIETEPAE
jgi:trigger factor